VKAKQTVNGNFAIASPTAIVAGGPHPNAAKAFAEFMIGDAVQNTFPQQGIYAARTDVPPPPDSPKLSALKLLAIDFDALAQHEGEVKARFNEIFQ